MSLESDARDSKYERVWLVYSKRDRRYQRSGVFYSQYAVSSPFSRLASDFRVWPGFGSWKWP